MHKISTFTFCLLMALGAQAQTLRFNIILFGDSVGNSIISRTKDANGIDNYVLDSRVKAKILWMTKENHTHYESKYKSGKLISAVYYEINNGKKDKWSNIQWDGSLYQVDSYHGKKSFKEAPTHSIGTLYLDRYDASRKRFFYEPEADYNELSFPDANTAEFKSSDGNRNIYHFRNGYISNVECHTTLATIYLNRIQ